MTGPKDMSSPRKNQRNVDHAPFRELLARRLDERLDAADRQRLDAHLSGCPRCRAVDREYRRQRQWLRGLPPIPAPRDLSARISAALDREVATGPRTFPVLGRARWVEQLGGRTVAGTGVGLIVAIVMLGLVSAYLPLEPGGLKGDEEQRPTPFQVRPRDLVAVSESGQGLTVSRTRIDQVCPAGEADCTQLSAESQQKIPVSQVKQPTSVSVAPRGDTIALTGRDPSGADVFAIVDLDPASGSTRPSSAPVRTPRPAPTTASPSQKATGSAGATASAPAASATTTTLPEVSASPADSAPPGDTSAQASPSDAGSTASPSEAAPSQPAPSPTPSQTALESFEATLPPGSAVPGEARAILSHVLAAGAPPAWSGDGGALAFSAMPADRSHGPDVYIWRPGDFQATALTTDHASYFASWAGTRIVASRAIAAEGVRRGSSIESTSVVIDPVTAEQRVLPVSGIWLPMVDPTERAVIFWRGFVAAEEPVTRVAEGRLLLGDWSALDPFRNADTDSGRRAFAAANDVSPASLTEQLTDWHVRWTKDGGAYGLWTAERTGSSKGRLTVVAVGYSAAGPEGRGALLGPVTAHRAFSLGVDRAAWVVPGPGGARAELRVGTWGDAGSGTVRIETVETTEALPGF
jgi:putative zinc finger protein